MNGGGRVMWRQGHEEKWQGEEERWQREKRWQREEG